MTAMAGASRYETILKLASGGMATVWIGNVRGALGFRQLVAIKKPHRHLLDDPTFKSELIAEARLASMISHANVVDVRDVEIDGDSISLVMDYIEGASLGDLIVAASRQEQRLAPRAAVRIVLDACAGLHAAHELQDERGRPVGLVHRDISPQNILVGSDGIARVADFGVAKFARKNMQSTSEGSLKGKLAYMAPEYVRGEPIDRRFDIFAMGVVLWEALLSKRLFRGQNEAETLQRLLELTPEPPSKYFPELAPLDDVVACALSKKREDRFQNAAAMAAALDASASAAKLAGGHPEVAAALKSWVGPAIEERRSLVRAKLANEPSVASLMGAPPIVAPDPAKAAPPTTVQRTPKMGGLPDDTLRDAKNMTAVPSTEPMSDAPPPPAARTLASPAAPQPIAPTVVSAPMVAKPASTLRSEAGQVEAPALAFQDPTRGAISLEVPSPPRGLPRRMPFLFPVLAAAAFFIIAGAALFYYRSQSSPETPTTAGTTRATASASASAVVPPVPSASIALSSSAEPVAKPPVKATVTPRAPVKPAQPPPPAQPAIKKPPPNPYEDKP
jgi:serine/threonine-protein kinase